MAMATYIGSQTIVSSSQTNIDEIFNTRVDREYSNNSFSIDQLHLKLEYQKYRIEFHPFQIEFQIRFMLSE